MSRRSLTLLETLIALTLVLAMAALIIPSMLKSMEERSFEAATDVTKEQLMMARAHAQATGNPVEVTYRPETSEVQARWFMPWLEERGAGQGVDSPVRSEINPLGPLTPCQQVTRGGSQTQSAEISESWAIRGLGRGIRIASNPPVSSEPETGPELAEMPDLVMSEDSTSYEELERGQEIRLAVFMPDGSALMGEPVFLKDGNGRCGRFSINPWSGLPIFERIGEFAESARKSNEKAASDRNKSEEQLADSTRKDRQRGAENDAPDADSSFDSDESEFESYGRGD